MFFGITSRVLVIIPCVCGHPSHRLHGDGADSVAGSASSYPGLVPVRALLHKEGGMPLRSGHGTQGEGGLLSGDPQ